MTSKKCVGPASGASTPRKAEKSPAKSASKAIKTLDPDSVSDTYELISADAKSALAQLQEDPLGEAESKADKIMTDTFGVQDETASDAGEISGALDIDTEKDCANTEDVPEPSENDDASLKSPVSSVVQPEMTTRLKSKGKAVAEKRSAELEVDTDRGHSPPAKKIRLETARKAKDASDPIKRTPTPASYVSSHILSTDNGKSDSFIADASNTFDASILTAMRQFYANKLQNTAGSISMISTPDPDSHTASSLHSFGGLSSGLLPIAALTPSARTANHSSSSAITSSATAPVTVSSPSSHASPIDSALLPHLLGTNHPLLTGACLPALDSAAAAERSMAFAYLQQANSATHSSLDSLLHFQRSIPAFGSSLTLPFGSSTSVRSSGLVTPLSSDLFPLHPTAHQLDVSTHATKLLSRTCGMSGRAIPSPSKATSNEMPTLPGSLPGSASLGTPTTNHSSCDEQPLDLSCKSRDTGRLSPTGPDRGLPKSTQQQQQLIRSLQQIMAAIPNDSSAIHFNHDLLRIAAKTMNKSPVSRYGKPERCDKRKSMLAGSID